MKYDDASWHYGGNFPKDLPTEAGAYGNVSSMGVAIGIGWTTSHERISREHRPSQITASYFGSLFSSGM